MFEITVFPIWACILIIAIGLGGMIGALALDVGLHFLRQEVSIFDGWSIPVGLLSLIASLLLMLSGVMNQHVTVDNPLNSDAHHTIQEAFDYDVDQSGFEKALIDETGAESIIIYNGNDSGNTFLRLQQGDFVRFDGIKEDSRIEGSVYFSKDSMVILMDENDAENKIVVPMK